MSQADMIRSFKGAKPTIADSAYIDETAVVIGDVTLEANSSVWPNAVLRADGGGTIVVRDGANIQDNAVCHADSPAQRVEIGSLATVGHCAIVHNARIGKRSLVGMNAVVLDDVTVEPHSIVAAGSVVTEGTVVESGTLVGGSPGRVLKDDIDRSAEWFSNGEVYVERAKRHATESVEITEEYR